MAYRITALAILILSALNANLSPVSGRINHNSLNFPIYTIPSPNANNINLGTSIAVRYTKNFDESEVGAGWFKVVGSLSGYHTGETILSDDHSTVLFKPEQGFSLGEKVTVIVSPKFNGVPLLGYDPYTFEFFTITQQKHLIENQYSYENSISETGIKGWQLPQEHTGQKITNPSPLFFTVPADFPEYKISTSTTGASDGYIFYSNWNVGGNVNYLLILKDSGEPVFYQRLGGGLSGLDFKKQPNGWLTYFSPGQNCFVALDSSYQIMNIYRMGNDYLADVHDLQILPNNHVLLMAYVSQNIDMTPYGGQLNATIVELVIQELDSRNNVVFEWRSWDHFFYTDSVVDLTSTRPIDYIHGNALELDTDGNILLSSRNLHEITKINRQTGEVLWRLGGKANQFIFNDEKDLFHWQHDIRRLANGNISIYDNNCNKYDIDHALFTCSNAIGSSRAVEYKIDEISKTAVKVWEYINTPPFQAGAMGNVQRLPNGNTLIGWGLSTSPSITEVKPNGTKVFELGFSAGNLSYRAFRFPWHGHPYWAPTLVVEGKAPTVTLYYSWNGATDISSYKIYGSKKNNSVPNELIATQTRTGFEDSTIVANESDPYCYFRIMPIDSLGRETKSSEIVTNPDCFSVKNYYLPALSNNVDAVVPLAPTVDSSHK